MKEDGKDSLVNKAYNGLGELLRACGFKEKIQHSTHKTNNNAGINCLIELLGRIERMNLQKTRHCTASTQRRFISCDAKSTATSRNALDPQT
jgi:hypothetical protein